MRRRSRKKKNNQHRTKRSRAQRNRLLQTVEYRHFRTLRLINIGIILLAVAGISYIGYFLYNKIYTTIGQVQNIILIESQMQGSIIDFETLEEAIYAWEEKYTTSTPPISRDPFSVAPTITEAPPSPAPTSTPDTAQ